MKVEHVINAECILIKSSSSTVTSMLNIQGSFKFVQYDSFDLVSEIEIKEEPIGEWL